MPVPFRDMRPAADTAFAGYLRFVDEPDGKGLRAALFLVDGSGEPMDFTFSRTDVPVSFLWRPGEARRRGVAELVTALFSACSTTPALLLARADEVPPAVFREDVVASVPIARIATDAEAPHSAGDVAEQLGDAIHVFWTPELPPAGSAARTTIDALVAGQFLLEPFERISRGLDEAFAA